MVGLYNKAKVILQDADKLNKSNNNNKLKGNKK